MRTNRREFLGLVSAAGAALPLGVQPNTANAQQPTTRRQQVSEALLSEAGPVSLFDGKTLKGWRTHGPSVWTVESGVLKAKGQSQASWLEFERGYQDLALRFSFRSTNAEVGVLLRCAPENWSRFSHPEEQSDKRSGVYVSLTGERPGSLSIVSLDKDWNRLDTKQIPASTATEPSGTDKLYPASPARIPIVGIQNAEAAATGYPPEPNILLSKRDDGWTEVEIHLRGSACPWDTSGIKEQLEQMSHYGTIALHVTGGSEPVSFREIVLFDLTKRLAAIPNNQPEGVKQLTDLFYAEGVSVGDLNRDGKDEIVTGPFYYSGPDYAIAHELYPPTLINPQSDGEGGNYTNCFLSYVHDFTGDGWPDVLMIMGFGPRPSFSAHLFVNPRGQSRHWDNYNVVASVDSETTQLVDIDGDGKPELILMQGDRVGYAKVGPDPTKPWTFHAVSDGAERAPHGMGVGDVNGNGRLDILHASGWWEQPAKLTDEKWAFHPVQFGATEGDFFLRGGADILVHDVNGDGVPDVITSLNGHGPGFAWFEQARNGQGEPTWKRHLIMGTPTTPIAERSAWEETDKSVAFTELHAVALADLDRDGGLCVITGKRWWSHGYVFDENAIQNAAVLYRFKLNRGRDGKVSWTPKLIHNASGVGTQIIAKDIDGDGQIEVVTTARKGTFIFRRPATT